MEANPRAVLEALVRERREDYAALSRLIGRNAAYIHQFIRRGTPRRLAEEDRRRLARYFGIDEALLGGPTQGAAQAAAADALVDVPRLDVGASAGGGAADPSERALGRIGFDPHWLRRLDVAPATAAMIRVEGDSMEPTLAHGDEILVDRAARRPRDGLFVLRLDGALLVKRVAVRPDGARISIRSDNPAYPGWPDCDPAAIDVVGRVVWVGRRL